MRRLSKLPLIAATWFTFLLANAHALQAQEPGYATPPPPLPSPPRYTQRYTTGFLPGLRFSSYFPRSTERLGTLYGASIDVVLVTWARQSEARGPSHGRAYLALDLLDSNKAAASSMFLYGIGATLSFERNPQRDFLIPTFTFEVGGLSQSGLGNKFIVTPALGLFLWTRENLHLTADAGYVLTTSSLLDDLRGLRLRAGVALTFW
ncbi:MAG: hypothetical protein SF187_00500 [Deltaproteobacteria bacterium]|nr:hypothetical protein [Deltaproteobacteria bacterium]